MKKLLITIALFMVAISAVAEDKTTTEQKTYKREGKVFVQSVSLIMPNDQVTAYVWRDTKGNEYPIILHTYTKGEKAGRITCYVIRTSAKSGKEYRYFLPDGEQIAREIINENL